MQFSNEKLGQRVREIRVASGVRQKDLAKQLGISYQQVQKYETGKDKIALERLYHIAEIFGASVFDFLQNSEATYTRKNDIRLMKAMHSLSDKQRMSFVRLAETLVEASHA